MEIKLPFDKEEVKKIIITIGEHCPTEYGLKNITNNCKVNDVERCLGCWFQALEEK